MSAPADDGPYLLMMAACFVCKRTFLSHPDRVPSFQGEPICRPCITTINARRRAAGRQEWPVLPDAYGPEEE